MGSDDATRHDPSRTEPTDDVTSSAGDDRSNARSLSIVARSVKTMVGEWFGRQPATEPTDTTCPECADSVVTAVAHELRTPLTTLRSLSEILHDNPELSDAERQAFLAALIEESTRLERAVERMLHASTTHPDRWCVEAAKFLIPVSQPETPANSVTS